MSKVPAGWGNTTFANHIDLLSGFAFKSEQYTSNDGDISLLRGDNIEPGALRWRNAKKWPFTQASQLERYQLREGDLVIAMDRTWVSAGLKVAEVEPHDLPCLLVQRVSRIRAKKTLVQSLLRQYFSGKQFENYVKAVQTETAVPHISSQQIKDFPLLLPPIKEQTKIAQILSTWDKAITTTEQLIGNSQQQKKSLMQSLLTGKKRLPGFEGEWSCGNFDDIFYIDNDKKVQVKSDEYMAVGTHPVVDQGKKLIAGYTDNSIVYQTVPVIIFGDHTRILKWVDFIFAPGADGTQIIKSKKNVVLKYGFYLLANTEIPNLGYSRHMRELKKKDFKFPENMDEQQKAAQILTAADNEIELLQKKLAFLKQEKAALMQQLLTGKRRVNVETA